MARTVGRKLTTETVYRALLEMEEYAAEEHPDSLPINPHGYRAADVAQELTYRPFLRPFRMVRWRQVAPFLDQLAEDGRLHRCVPGQKVPYYRTVGG